jgi:hypothetical protein
MEPISTSEITYEPVVREAKAGRRNVFVVAPRSAGASLGDQQAEMGWAGYLRSNLRPAEREAPSARSASTLRIRRHVTCPHCRSQAYLITFAWTETGRLVRGRCELCGAHGEWHHLKAAVRG